MFVVVSNRNWETAGGRLFVRPLPHPPVPFTRLRGSGEEGGGWWTMCFPAGAPSRARSSREAVVNDGRSKRSARADSPVRRQQWRQPRSLSRLVAPAASQPEVFVAPPQRIHWDSFKRGDCVRACVRSACVRVFVQWPAWSAYTRHSARGVKAAHNNVPVESSGRSLPGSCGHMERHCDVDCEAHSLGPAEFSTHSRDAQSCVHACGAHMRASARE